MLRGRFQLQIEEHGIDGGRDDTGEGFFQGGFDRGVELRGADPPTPARLHGVQDITHPRIHGFRNRSDEIALDWSTGCEGDQFMRLSVHNA